MQVDAQPFTLHLTTPFRISRGVQQIATNLLIRVHHNDYVGFGEAAPRAFFGETIATSLAALETYIPLLGEDPYATVAIAERMARALPHHGSLRAAIDMALYDLAGKMFGAPVYRLLGLSAQHLPPTSFTIGLATPDEMARKAAAAQYPILKIKLGTPDDLAIIRAIREVSNATLRVDANAGWTVKTALQMIEALAPYHIEMIEQPIPPGNVAGLRLLRERSPIPIFADEDCVDVADVARLAGAVDGINIKLAKCGGLTEAIRMIHVARSLGMRIMLGCMIESSLGITAAAHLAPLVDMLDLDGSLLVDDDPCTGVHISEGELTLPADPGLGIVFRLTPSADQIPNHMASPSRPTPDTTHLTLEEQPTMMDSHPTRADALALMQAHVQQDSLRKHMLSVEAAMRAYARKFDEDEEIFAITGLLHDCDYEEYPDLHEHTQIAAGWLRDGGYDPRIIQAILAHNDVNQLPREDRLARTLVACDEITGLVTAAALVRPDRSIMALETPSIRKKMRDKAFARSINRDDIINGASALGVELDDHITFVIEAMRGIADDLGLKGNWTPTA